MKRRTLTTIALAAALGAPPAMAQHVGHEMSSMPGMTVPNAKKAAAKPVPRRASKAPTKGPTARSKSGSMGADAHTDADMSGMDMSHMDHTVMGHSAHRVNPSSAHAAETRVVMPPATGTAPPAPNQLQTQPGSAPHAGMDMSGMDMSEMNHAAMGHQVPAATPSTSTATGAVNAHGMDHSGMDMSMMQGMDHGAMGHDAVPHARDTTAMPADAAPLTPIPLLTDADRAAAFPPLTSGHAAHDRETHAYLLMDRFEARDGGRSGAWEARAWVGGDTSRLWLRSEGEVEDGAAYANVELLYGRSITPWWDVVGGIRQDIGDSPSRTWLAIGAQGLAPYKFEVEATAYVGAGGRTAARLETEYDTLLTNRLILQWRGEANLYGKRDAALGVGSGLSTVEAGARLRYEINRRFAPYVGVEFQRAFGGTAALRRADGHAVTDTRAVAGIRFWF